MSDALIGYTRCGTSRTSLPNANGSAELGVTEKRIYLDHGLTGTNRKRSVPDARDIGGSLTRRGVQPDRSDVAGIHGLWLSQPRNGSGVTGEGSITKLR